MSTTRRHVLKTIGFAVAAATTGHGAAFAASSLKRKLQIGHTCITWKTFPQRDDTTLQFALKDIFEQGLWSFETFPEVIEDWDRRGLLVPLLQKYSVPMRSSYITADLIDPAKRKAEIDRITRLVKVVGKFKGSFIVLAPNSVKRDGYDFSQNRSNIIAALNDYAAAITDLGFHTGLHQHTGTCIETRDEVYAVMDGVNTRNMQFAPDVGQLQKGGADAAKVVKDYLPLVRHMHLKDYKGWDHYVGYCPLGMGSVDLTAILDMVERQGLSPNIMVELDPSDNDPMSPLETVKITKTYLEKLGYEFRSRPAMGRVAS